VNDVLTKVTEVLAHPYAQAVLIVTAAYILAAFVNRLCGRMLVRFFVGRDSDAGNQVIGLLHRPIYITLILTGTLLAGYRLGIDSSAGALTFGIINSILVVMWTVLAYRLFKVMLTALLKSEQRQGIVQPSTAPAFSNAVVVLLFVIASYSILLVWDINITGLIASAGILGLALSLAAQDTLSNLFAGVSILADRSYEIGDYIVLDSGERGEVTHIGLRSTRILTRDDVGITIPNGVIAGAKVVNEAAGPRGRYRIRTKVGIAYGSDVRDVLALLEQIAKANEEICDVPAPRVRFRAFGDSSLELELLCWIRRPADRGRLVHELNCSIYETFATRKITIPFPQREITLREQHREGECCA